jgi:alpha-galactosidase
MEVGPVFIENRYTDWHNYWPHQTLRNLWKLSHYVDPVRLRMEFLNNTRNQGKYAGDRLAPAAYTPDTLFATVLFSSPLGWFESSNLPEPFIASAAKLVNLWKRERAQMFGGSLYPIGSAPDGVAWTGFASVARNRKSGYLLLFREANDDAEWTTTDLPPFDGTHFRVETLAGTGSAEFVNGRLRARIPSKLQYLWLKLSTAH